MIEDSIEYIDDYQTRPLTLEEARQVSKERGWKFFAGHEGQTWILAYSPPLKVSALILKSEYDSLREAGLWEKYWAWKDAIKDSKVKSIERALTDKDALMHLVTALAYYRMKFPKSMLVAQLEAIIGFMKDK